MTRWLKWSGAIAVIATELGLLWKGEFLLVTLSCATFVIGYFWPGRCD